MMLRNLYICDLEVLIALLDQQPFDASMTQPIDLEDVLESIKYCIEETNPKKVYDIGGEDIITYRQMLELTAKVLGLKRRIYNVPFFSPGLSKMWVSKVTSTAALSLIHI